jgi:hypothetical protein
VRGAEALRDVVFRLNRVDRDVVAPASRAPWMTEIPTPPQPMITTVEPGRTCAVLRTAPTPVSTPQAISAAVSNGTSESTLIAPAAGMTTSSAKVPRPA